MSILKFLINLQSDINLYNLKIFCETCLKIININYVLESNIIINIIKINIYQKY